MAEAYTYCRACMKGLGLFEITKIKNNPNKPDLPLLLKRYVPEFDINVNNPCLCFECVSTLYSFHNFKKQCLQTEENLRLFVREHPKVKKVDIVAVQIYHEGTTLPIINKDLTPKSRTDPSVLVKNYKRCDLCTRTYATAKALWKHKQNIHNAQRKKCDECGRDFSSEIDYDKHMLFHADPNMHKYKCDNCGFTYQSSAALKKHHFTHASWEERPFQCHICKTRFIEKSVLKVHMRRHTGEKPYKCEKCKYTTSILSQLYKHYSRIHSMHLERKNRRDKNDVEQQIAWYT